MIESQDAVIDEGVFQRVIAGEELPVAEAIANKIAILKDFSADRKRRSLFCCYFRSLAE